jgi:putative membrane protein
VKFFLLFLKGFGMGAANVIPGVSGGTIALVTGVYEELIESLKSFNIQAIRLLLKKDFKGFSTYIHLDFLIVLFLGVGLSIVSLAKLIEYLFNKNEQLVWSFFFGLILASIYYVGKMVKNWNIISVSSLTLGIILASALAFIKPVSENASIYYLILCGVVAVSSMILPGLSGSYVLILMGNYQLIMLQSVSDPINNMSILLPVVIGAIIGFLGLSHGISYVLKKFYNPTISLLTGFVIGSLIIIWPWKIASDTITARNGDLKVVSYEWLFPEINTDNLLCLILILAGIILVWLVEFLGTKLNSKKVN